MPEVNTRHFGLIECEDEAVLLFPLGLPAFENARRFVLIERPATSPLVFLQSLDSVDLCFVLMPVRIIVADYRPWLGEEDLQVLGFRTEPVPENELAVFAILSLAEDRHPTANLLAPILINVALRLGVQAIRLDDTYSHQHSLAKVVQRCS
jgi:flagellar assembly factor FliW